MSSDHTRGPTRWQIDAAGVSALVVLTVIAYFLILAPIASTRMALVGLRNDLVQTRSRAAEIRGVEATVNAELTRLQTEIEASPVRLEASDHLNRRLARLMSLAADHGLVIHETRAGNVVGGARFDLVPIEVSGSGSYPSCARFFDRLNADLPDVEVVGFEIAGQPANPGAAATFRFSLSWYAAPSVAAAPQELGN